ncbi:hypothetical protein KDW_60690 [Dictyobacter vulcani]|uniref:Uncharacterized protein n=1 Tax=Dictyobacter vulcani TaxID=2607529 RepID=A0A5J4KZE4_9CHLR|nr:hypothetical protein [Dictyobacter vulcani]GER91907.1 hypothetical protein KDW_60690 [Dictyobacter vulcani]
MHQSPSPIPGDPYSPPSSFPNALPPLPQREPPRRPEAGRVAVMFGSIIGILLSALFIFLSYVLPHMKLTTNAGLYLVYLWSLPLLVQWFLYLAGGFIAAWRTGKVRAGVFTSLWINLWYFLSVIVVYFLQQSAITRQMLLSDADYTFLFMVFAASFLIISVGLGAGLAALGGLAGKALSYRQR